MRMTRHHLARLAGLVLLGWTTLALAAANDEWTRPFPAVHIVGNLYAVGTYDLQSFLLTSDEGHILINTGLKDSTAQIRANIESLGFRLEDVKILLTMQAHFDHTAALAEIKSLTGAQMWATKKDARVLEDGGASDPHFGGNPVTAFAPVKVDRIIRQGDVITLGKTTLTVYEHPGHTEGSSSYGMTASEGGKTYNVLIANMGTINPGKRLFLNPTYPGCGKDFAETYAAQRAMNPDIWVAAHASQYGLHDKYKPGQSYSPETFVDPDGFHAAVEKLDQIFLRQVLAEQLEGEQS